MPDSTLLLGLAVVLPVALGLVTLWLPRGWVGVRVGLAALGPAAAFGLVAWHAASYGVEPTMGSVEGGPRGTGVWEWLPSLNVNVSFLADGLGVFFALLVSGIGVLIVLYARGYFGAGEGGEDDLYRFYPTLGFFTTAMLGIVLSDYTLLTLLFWEMTSISSFLLIGWDRYDKVAVRLAMQAFFTTGLGGMALFGGVLLLGNTTGAWRWSELLTMAHGWHETGVYPEVSSRLVWAFVLLFIGAATKSAQWPFHYWLPGAMAAPTPVSAFLHSATMVKAGVFLAGRMLPIFGAGLAIYAPGGFPLWPGLLIGFGSVTMLLGAVLAIHQHDLKRIFAYTTVSQLGLLMAMYGLGGIEYGHGGHLAPSIDWDLTQIANHAFYKAPLFITAGAIGHLVGTRELPELFGLWWRGGLVKRACIVTMLVAGYALAAGPLTLSFTAKELFLYGVVHAASEYPIIWIVLAMTVATAALNIAIFVRLATTLLGSTRFGMRPPSQPDPLDALHDNTLHGHGLGHDEHDEPHGHEHGLWAHMLWLPAAIIVSLQIIGGILPGVWSWAFAPLEANTYYFDKGIPSLLYAVQHPSLPLLMSGVGILIGVPLGLSRLMRGSHVDVHDRVYPAMYWLSVTGGGHAFRLIQTGRLRHYLLFIITAVGIGFVMATWLDLATASRVGGDMLDRLGEGFAQVGEFWPGVMLGAIICVTAIALPFTQVRVVRVVILGACGFSVVGMYLIYQAPDLALTQLMFEIISVILFVLVLRLLPEPSPRRDTGAWWRVLVSTAAGLAFGWITLVAALTPDTFKRNPVLGVWHAMHSYTGSPETLGRGGGGANIVNVILVDFRGFDTLGEITVLALAAMGVWSLMPGSWMRRLMRKAKRNDAVKGGAA